MSCYQVCNQLISMCCCPKIQQVIEVPAVVQEAAQTTETELSAPQQIGIPSTNISPDAQQDRTSDSSSSHNDDESI